MKAKGVVVLMGLKPLLHLTVDSRDVIMAQHPTHLPLGLCLGWGFLMSPFEGFPWTLKKLSAKPPMLIGIVTCGISSSRVGEVSPFGASMCGASTGAPSTHLAPISLIIFKQQTRTTFDRVKSNVRNIHTQC